MKSKIHEDLEFKTINMSKKLLPILIILISVVHLNSQSLFCPPGAGWNFVYNAFLMDPTPDLINVAAWNGGKTILNGETVTILKHSKLFAQCNMTNIYESYLKEVGDTVFIKNIHTNNQWRILFNFAASPGHSWVTSLSFAGVSFTVTVDSVGSILKNNLTLKVLHASYKQSNPPRSYKADIIERIGGSYFLFNFYHGPVSDGDYMTEYLCYQDSALGLLQFSNKPCYYSNLTSLSENNLSSLFRMYPNPTSDFLHIDLTRQEEAEVKIIDITGKERSNIRVEGSAKIPVYDLPNGIYLLNVYEGKEKTFSTKFIKE
ncbi:hypothetical protein CNR22_05425 [Sphingobacteriaceae bacterium]|nr:hypothetical protein CNR22_05425 [Sphingobacteriaceae bacterium]